MEKKRKKHFPPEWDMLKIVRKMKLTVVFTLLVVMTFGNSYSQETNLSFNLKNADIKQVLQEIEDQSNYIFLYRDEIFDLSQKYSIDLQNKSIEDILNLLSEKANVDYEIHNRQIILKSRSEFFSNQVKQIKLNGKITDTSGQPLPGVTVVVKGTTNGTISNFDGVYSLSDVPSDGIIQFSFVGMKMQEIPVAGKTTIDVVMEEDAIGIEEIVAIGYGTMKKSDLTGAIGSVSGDKIGLQAFRVPIAALGGLVSGVQISQNSGEPGNALYVRIRGENSINGSNEPLYVVDGFPISGSIDNLNSNEIVSIEVLKDASATAIYGSRGANGVVLITTQKGKKGKTSVKYEGYYGIQKVAKTIDMLNAEEFAILANERAANDGINPYFSESEITSLGKGTNWQDEIFRIAPIQNHTVSLTGGSEKRLFNVSCNYFNQEGIIIDSDYERYQLKTDFEQDISEKWNISLSSILNRIVRNGVQSDNTTRGNGVLSGGLVTPPTLSVYSDDGSYTNVHQYAFSPDVAASPVLIAKEIKNKGTRSSALLNLSVEGQLSKNLVLKSSVGIEYFNTRSDYYSSILYDTNYNGRAKISYTDFLNILNENTLTYTKKFGKNHNLTVLGGITAQKTTSQSVSAATNGYLTDVVENYNLSSGSNIETPTSGYTDYSMLSYLGRINYSYKGRYLLTASFRADGSSRFGENNKYAYFPSTAIAWRVSEENFWDKSSKISNLKVRASYGQTGNQAIASYQTLSTLASSSAVLDKETVIGYTVSTVKNNPDLKWETTTQWDVGIDIGLLNNRISFAFDYYHKRTDDLLALTKLAVSSGYTEMYDNIGSIQNKGFELSSTFKLIQKTFTWDLGINVSANRNRALSLYKGADITGTALQLPFSSYVTLIREGYPIGLFYGYREDGLTENGNINYIDNNNDGQITTADKEIIGDPNPDFLFGINSYMSWKNFGLTILMDGVQGNDIFNFNLSNVANSFNYGLNQLKDLLGNYWTEENPNPNAKYPKISGKTTFLTSDRYIEDGSYLRIKNIELSYTFKTNRFRALPFNNIQIYAGIQNLITFTKYSWYTPEVNTLGVGINKGIDQTGYPNAKTVLFGVKIKL